jgi:hypothetical protein
MTIPVRSEIQADARPMWRPILYQELPLRPATVRSFETCSRPQLSTAELAYRIVAVFRAHPHINNVLTHISRANWAVVEHALNTILDPTTTSAGLSPLAQNIVDLMCAERGITGKILKPHFHAALYRLLGPNGAELLIRHIEALFLELKWNADHPAPAASSSVPLQGDRP